MHMHLGDINRLKVNRKTDIGYMLESSEGEIFLHNNESEHRPLAPGDVVDAFLYVDNKGRLAATLKQPLITVKQPGFLKVTDVLPQLGVFLDMGINKDLLMSKDDLPQDHMLWPKPDDQLYVTIKVKNKLTARIVPKDEIKLNPENPLSVKTHIEAIVHKIGKEGLNLLSDQGHWVFVHHNQIKTSYRLGERLSVKITYVSDKGYSGQIGPQKEVAMQDDANIILDYLKAHHVMPLTSDSPPEAIDAVFHMSKKAFKRALGTLYKQRKIVFENGQTHLHQDTEVKS